jgi:hypothetical protein
MDSNGVPDLVWQSDHTGEVGTWDLSAAQATTVLHIAFQASGSFPDWRIVGVNDLDSNGVPDLIWQHRHTRR